MSASVPRTVCAPHTAAGVFQSHQEYQRAVQYGQLFQVFGQSVGCPCRVRRNDMEAAADAAVRDGNSRRSRNGYCRGDTGDFLERNSCLGQRLRLLTAAAEHKGITALEPAHGFSLPRQIDQECIDLPLRHAVVSTALACRDFFRIRASHLQKISVHQRIVYNGIR